MIINKANISSATGMMVYPVVVQNGSSSSVVGVAALWFSFDSYLNSALPGFSACRMSARLLSSPLH